MDRWNRTHTPLCQGLVCTVLLLAAVSKLWYQHAADQKRPLSHTQTHIHHVVMLRFADLVCVCVCSRRLVSSSSNVVEIDDAAIDHSAVTREPAGLAALDTIFAKLGMRKGTPVAAAEAMGYPVTNSPRGKASSTVEERGTKG